MCDKSPNGEKNNAHKKSEKVNSTKCVGLKAAVSILSNVSVSFPVMQQFWRNVSHSFFHVITEFFFMIFLSYRQSGFRLKNRFSERQTFLLTLELASHPVDGKEREQICDFFPRQRK